MQLRQLSVLGKNTLQCHLEAVRIRTDGRMSLLYRLFSFIFQIQLVYSLSQSLSRLDAAEFAEELCFVYFFLFFF